MKGLYVQAVSADNGDVSFVTTAAAYQGVSALQTGPVLVFAVAIPSGASNLRVRLERLASDTIAADVPYRMPAEAGGVEVASVSEFRGYTIATLRYRPVGGAGIGRADRDVEFHLSWSGARQSHEKPGTSKTSEIPAVQNLLRHQIVNFDEARHWHHGASVSALLQGSADWGMGEAVVLFVPGDGAYSQSAAEIRAVTTSSFDRPIIADLRLYNRNESVAFAVVDRDSDGRFGGDDRLEFAGRRNVSSNTQFYFDSYTDTNAYVLSWHGGAGMPPGLQRVLPSQNTIEILSYDSTIHIESEEIYYSGRSLPQPFGDVMTIHNNDRVANERYYWGRASFPQQWHGTFVCAPWYAPGGRHHVSLRLIGVSDTVHHLTLGINGLDIVDVEVVSFADTLLSFDVPSQLLINGTNTITVKTRRPPSYPSDADWRTPDEVFIDYLEVAGLWSPSSFGGTTRVQLGSAGGGRVRVAGFTNAPVRAISSDHRSKFDSIERGHLFRLSSRQFVPGMRYLPGFVLQFPGQVIESQGEGIVIAEVSSSGSLVRNAFFFTHTDPTAFDAATRFLQDVTDGNIVVAGFSIGGGRASLPAPLVAEFARLGSTAISRSDLFVAAWAFAARKGDPSSATERIANLVENDQGVTLDAFIADPLGTSWRGVAWLDGAAGEEYQLDAERSLRMRYRATDSLIATSNAADLLIITHSAFRAESERLARHRRSHDTLRVAVIDVQTIYDEFNHGIKSPLAIRRFIHYADSNWTKPAPIYVLLMGDASYDPQQRQSSSLNIDYIPTNGIPASDYLYTVAIGDTTQRWQQLIGRLPVNTPSEARAIVDKLIEYDGLQPEPWNKHFVFMDGGNSRSEVDRHRDEDNSLASDYVTSYSFLGDTSMIFRTSQNLGFPDAIDGAWARSSINRGALWVSFAGHGASRVYDLDFGFPAQLDNAGRYFVLATFSCLTGSFADPNGPARNELWLTYPGLGGVAAIGGTSYSFPAVDAPFKQLMFGDITIDHSRVLGEIFTTSKYNAMFAGWELSWGQGTYEGQRARNVLLMYHLLGDPSMKLVVRNTPELGFRDVTLLSESGGPSVPGDSVVIVSGQIWNYGRVLLNGDSMVTVVAEITDGAQNRAYDTLRIPPVARTSPIVLRLPLGRKPGEYRIRLLADPQRVFNETWLADNDTTLVLRVRGNQLLPIEPLPYGRVASRSDLEIRLLNPPVGGGATFMLDTTAMFNAASRFTSADGGTVVVDELTTTWRLSIPDRLSQATRYWWRAVSTSGDPSVAALFPTTESFTIGPAGSGEFVLGGEQQFADGSIVDLQNNETGVGPGEQLLEIEAMSVGQRWYSSRRVSARVGKEDFFTINYDGLNVVVFPPNNNHPRAQREFAFYLGVDHINRFNAFIDSVLPGERVIIAASGPSLSWGDSADAVKARLRAMGASDMIDSLVDEVDSYVLIGGRVPASEVAEARNNQSMNPGKRPPFPAIARSTMRVIAQAGSLITPVAGPSRLWRRASVDGVGLDHLGGTLLGVRRDGTLDTLMSVASMGAGIDLSSIDAAIHPQLRMLLSFPADTTVRLRSVAYHFDPTPELALVPSTTTLAPDSVMQGDPAVFTTTVVNLSRQMSSLPTLLRLNLDNTLVNRTVDSAMIPAIAPLDSVVLSLLVVTGELGDYTKFDAIVNPEDTPSEPYAYNNVQSRTLRVATDANSPSSAVYVDNRRLIDGDYVQPTAEFEVRIYDNSLLKLDSFTTVRRLIFDNEIIDASSAGVRFEQVDNGEHRASFFYRPSEPLSEGTHELKVYAVDASGNADTADFLAFNVDRSLRLRNVVNWPNPFERNTTFTFLVSGEEPPHAGEIAIFTVAGRRIRSIPLSPAIIAVGFNRVEWDGLDQDGDRLANGVYFYRVRLDGANGSAETIEKLVIMR